MNIRMAFAARLIALALLTHSSIAYAMDKADDAIMSVIEQRMAEAKKKGVLTGEVSEEMGRIRLEHRVQKYSVHPILRDRVLDKTIIVEGPAMDGLIVTIYIDDAPNGTMPVIPFGYTRKWYWTNYENGYRINNSKRCIYLIADYGRRFEKRDLCEIRRILESLGKSIYEVEKPEEIERTWQLNRLSDPIFRIIDCSGTSAP